MARLERQGAQVFAVARRQPVGSIVSGRLFQADLAQSADAERVFSVSRPEIVFHMASQVLGARDIRHVSTTLQANLVAAVNILTCATESGCERVVMAGSMEEPVDHDCPPIPSSPYAAAKWAATGYARMFHALYQTPVVMARIFMVYGPGQKDLKKLIPYVITSLLQGDHPQVSAGTRPVDWIYIDDVVAGLLRCGATPGICGERFDLGTGVTETVRGVVEALGRIIEAEDSISFGAVPDRAMETVRVAQTGGKNSRLGWQANLSLDEGLRRTVEWYRTRSA